MAHSDILVGAALSGRLIWKPFERLLSCHSCESRNPAINGSLLPQGRSLDSRLHACVPKRLYFGVQARE